MSDSEDEKRDFGNPFVARDDPNMPFAPQKPTPDVIQEEQEKARIRQEEEAAAKRAAKKQLHVDRANAAKKEPDSYVQVSAGKDTDEQGEFFVERSIAETCDAWAAAIDFKSRQGAAEGQCIKIEFSDIRGPVMEKVVEYLYWRQDYLKNCDPGMVDEFEIDDDVALDLLKASTLFNLHN